MNDLFKTEILSINKVTKILEKGKVIRFKVVVCTGNGINLIGLGVGKDVNFHVAKQKAINSSYKKLIYIKHSYLSRLNDLDQNILIKVKKNKVYFKPNLHHTGLRCARIYNVLLDMAGFKQIIVKRIGSRNLMNDIYAFFLFVEKFNELAYDRLA